MRINRKFIIKNINILFDYIINSEIPSLMPLNIIRIIIQIVNAYSKVRMQLNENKKNKKSETLYKARLT